MPIGFRGQRGFTLLEVMVVVVILGILAALVVPKIISRPDEARVIAEYKFSVGGLRVEVSGTFSPEDIKGPDGNTYDVVGVIDVTSIKKAGSTSVSPPTTQWTRYNEDGTCPSGYVDYGIPLQCVTPEYMEYCKTNSCPL